MLLFYNVNKNYLKEWFIFFEYVLSYVILGSKLIVFNVRFMSEIPIPCSLLFIFWKLENKDLKYYFL
jgi:hypothetical protein